MQKPLRARFSHFAVGAAAQGAFTQIGLSENQPHLSFVDLVGAFCNDSKIRGKQLV